MRMSISSRRGDRWMPEIAEAEQLRDRRGASAGATFRVMSFFAVEVGELELRFAAKVDLTDHDALPGGRSDSRHAAKGGAAKVGVEDGSRHDLGERFAIEVGAGHDALLKSRWERVRARGSMKEF